MSNLADLKQQIINDIPISAIIGQYIPLTKKGTSTLAVCPFHDDHKPSMNVTDDRKYFKCFACGEGGNAIDFVMKFKNMEFVDALKEISDRNSICFDDFITKKSKPPKVLMAEKILTKATQVYKKIAETKQFQPFEDFLKKRALPHTIFQTYQLGFAPKHNAITEYLSSIPSEKEKKMAISVATEIGLIRENSQENIREKGFKSHYDTFRERIMFPIWDHFGQVIGYTSRATSEYQKAKYMNSKDSFIFNKRNILYGLHLAKKSIRERSSVLLVEGNMDQITLLNKGFSHSVAIQGIAISDSSIRTLRTLTANFYLALDNDPSGFKAMERINEQCLFEGIIPKYIDLSPCKDPDEFLNQHSTIEFQKRIDEAQVFLDVELKKMIPAKAPELLDAQLRLLKKAFQKMAPLKTELAATERLVKFATSIGLKSDPAAIIDNYKDYLKQGQQTQFPENNTEGHIIEDLFQDYQENNAQRNFQEIPLNPLEKRLLKELIKHPECLIHQDSSDLLDFVTSNEVKKYLLQLKGLIYEIDENEFSSMAKKLTTMDQYGKELTDTVFKSVDLFIGMDLPKETVDKILKDLKTELEKDHLKELRRDLNNEKNKCQTKDDLNNLMKEMIELDKKLIQINNQKYLKP